MLTDKERAEFRDMATRNEKILSHYVATLATCSIDMLIRFRVVASVVEGSIEHNKQIILIDAIGRFVYGEKYDREVEKG